MNQEEGTVVPKDDAKVKISTSVDIKFITRIEMPNGEKYIFDKKLEAEDNLKISMIWGKTRTEEILRMEQDARTEIIQYLQSKGYKLIYEEKLRFT